MVVASSVFVPGAYVLPFERATERPRCKQVEWLKHSASNLCPQKAERLLLSTGLTTKLSKPTHHISPAKPIAK